MEAYLRRKEGAEEAAGYATDIRLRAERRIGELTKEMPRIRPRPGKPLSSMKSGSKTAHLEAVGVSPTDAFRCERIASIPEPVFEEEVQKPKASTAERMGSNHPTAKPVALMAYLVRLVTPSRGLVLDPFMGSGTTGRAARAEGFRFIGLDLEREYLDDAQRKTTNVQVTSHEEAPPTEAIERSLCPRATTNRSRSRRAGRLGVLPLRA